MTSKAIHPREFLEEAAAAQKARGIENGYDSGEERSMAHIVAVFNALTGSEMSEADGWRFMMVLKLVRSRRKFQRDSIVDLAAYAALLGECQSTEE